ncbi:hypothetical protein METHB2_90016 [Candidatus Methylobacter favarea]|uniref:Formaldehyde-activating enzyme domain-containing protein n=1 Tax=Candidatus Methylobacter favarea TaxID=2707345 RepID=A0A8S0Y752_9GAMM|nr:hypothetical protein METHB2_90016 [Candidatus Methylobacter favarea]
MLALAAPNLMAKPNTVMFNKVEIKNEQQASQMFGRAKRREFFWGFFIVALLRVNIPIQESLFE